MIHTPRRLLVVVATLALVLVVACGSGNDAATPPSATEGVTTPVATPLLDATASTPTATPEAPAEGGTPLGAAGPDASVDNVVRHVAALAEEIGVRAAGTDGERQAAAYVASVLEDAGYESTIEPFPIATQIDGSSVTIEGDRVEVRPFIMNGSAMAEATGTLIYGGLGALEDLAALDIAGRVLLLDRGVLTFGTKARNAELAGAVAVVIANNEPGTYSGNLGDRPATIPVVAITRDEGIALRPLADSAATATVRASIDSVELESQNVVGRSGESCRVYIGGHYDSIPNGPGANDNATGTALMLELARIHRVDGLCVVAFGAEEIGLLGSESYVADNNLEDARFMLNFDVVGLLGAPIVIGDAALTQLLLGAVGDLPVRAGQFPPFASSDHVSFLDAGIPAVTITSGEDPVLHTPDDTADHLSTDALDTMLQIGDLALGAALAAAG